MNKRTPPKTIILYGVKLKAETPLAILVELPHCHEQHWFPLSRSKVLRNSFPSSLLYVDVETEEWLCVKKGVTPHPKPSTADAWEWETTGYNIAPPWFKKKKRPAEEHLEECPFDPI
jgi:hypothetical protein